MATEVEKILLIDVNASDEGVLIDYTDELKICLETHFKEVGTDGNPDDQLFNGWPATYKLEVIYEKAEKIALKGQVIKPDLFSLIYLGW